MKMLIAVAVCLASATASPATDPPGKEKDVSWSFDRRLSDLETRVTTLEQKVNKTGTVNGTPAAVEYEDRQVCEVVNGQQVCRVVRVPKTKAGAAINCQCTVNGQPCPCVQTCGDPACPATRTYSRSVTGFDPFCYEVGGCSAYSPTVGAYSSTIAPYWPSNYGAGYFPPYGSTGQEGAIITGGNCASGNCGTAQPARRGIFGRWR